MKRYIKQGLSFIILAMFLFGVTPIASPITAAAAAVWDGTAQQPPTSNRGSSAADPILIETPQHLAWLAGQANAELLPSGKYFRLTADLDLGGSQGRTWTPIGVNGIACRFDGDGHTISNLSFKSNQYRYAGLFGSVTNTTIKNIRVELAANPTPIYFNGNLLVGGLAASSWTSAFENCSVIGNIAASGQIASVGGLVGSAGHFSDKIINSYYIGNITSYATEDSRAGGIAGICSGDITNCFAKGNRVAEGQYAYAGGITSLGDGKIELCYSIGNVTTVSGNSSSRCGGLVGEHTYNGYIANSYSVGNTSATGAASSIRLGGILGSLNHSDLYYFKNCYWNTDYGQTENGAARAVSAQIGVGNRQPDNYNGIQTSQMLGNDAIIHMTKLNFATDWTTKTPMGNKRFFPQLTVFATSNNPVIRADSEASVMLLVPSSEANLISVRNQTIAWSGGNGSTTLVPKTGAVTFSESMDALTLTSFVVSEDASIVFGSSFDSLSDANLPLLQGMNTVCAKVTAQDGTVCYYSFIVTVLSSEAKVHDVKEMTVQWKGGGGLSSDPYIADLLFGEPINLDLGDFTISEHASIAFALGDDFTGLGTTPISLDVGTHTIYAKVTAQNGTEKYYILTVVILSSAAEILTMWNEPILWTGASPLTASLTFNHPKTLGMGDFTISDDASVVFGTDPGELGTSDILLPVGVHTVIATVTAQNGTEKNHVITITILSSAAEITRVWDKSVSWTGGDGSSLASPLTGNITLGNPSALNEEDFTISADASVQFGLDAASLAATQLLLDVGSATVAIEVTAQNGDKKYYSLVVVVLSSEADILAIWGKPITWSGGDGSESNPLTSSITLDQPATLSIDDFTVSPDATLKFKAGSDFNNLGTEPAELTVGTNAVSATVQALNGQLRYSRFQATVLTSDEFPVNPAEKPYEGKVPNTSWPSSYPNSEDGRSILDRNKINMDCFSRCKRYGYRKHPFWAVILCWLSAFGGERHP